LLVVDKHFGQWAVAKHFSGVAGLDALPRIAIIEHFFRNMAFLPMMAVIARQRPLRFKSFGVVFISEVTENFFEMLLDMPVQQIPSVLYFTHQVLNECYFFTKWLFQSTKRTAAPRIKANKKSIK
jgi:hypothetical protein